MSTTTRFYICPTCFVATDTELGDHPHIMLGINLSVQSTDDQCPPRHSDGTLQTRRPKWFLAATQPSQRQPHGGDHG